MSENTKMSDEENGEGGFSRRRLLSLAGVGLMGSFAGCESGSNETGTPTDTTRSTDGTPSPTPTQEPTPEPTRTATSTPPSTETDTTTSTQTQTQSSTPAQGVDTTTLEESPGSTFAATDGFANVEWLTNHTPEVITVTNVATSGQGSLRWAIEQTGPRIIIFEVGGVIDLDQGRLEVSDDRCWIAGQTAPSPGITIVRGDLWITGNDCVLQHIRVRPGDAGRDDNWEPDSIRTGDGTSNNIIDHCTATWSIDENVSPGYDATATTISNSLIAEGLNDATHPKGPHSMGLLVGDRSVENAIVGNVFAHNKRRNPRLKADTQSVVLNNIMYHFDSGTAMGSTGTAVVEANGYHRVNDSFNIKGGAQGDQQPDAYVADNYTSTDNEMTNGQLTRLDSRPFWPTGLEALPPDEVESHNFSAAGARPADRTPHDERVLEQVRTDEGSYIDSQSEVGGYPDLSETSRSLSPPDPGDGLGAWLAQHTRAVELPSADPP